MPFTSTSSPEYGCSWPPPPWSSPPGPRSRPRRRRLRGLPTSPPSPCDWLFWLLRLFWFWLFWFWLLRLFWPCPDPGRFRVCCWPDDAPCPFCADPLFSLPSASSGGSTKMPHPGASSRLGAVAIPIAAGGVAVGGHAGGIEDLRNDVGLFGPGRRLERHGLGDGVELFSLFAFKYRSFELLLRSHRAPLP